MKNLFCIVAGLLLAYVSEGQIISTIAGCDSCGLIGDGGPATNAQLFHPISVAFDAGGNCYITDRDHDRIRKVTPAGIITTIAGTGVGGFSGDGGQATAAKIANPYGIALDAAGNIYFADFNRIRKINAAGIITTIAGTGTGSYNGENIPATTAGIQPGGVAIDNAGTIYFADGNERIRKIDASGLITTIAGTGFAGYNGDEIPATNAELNRPNYVAVDPVGNIFVADNLNNRVRKIDASGIIHTIAGDGASGYSGDNGPATDAMLNGPLGVFADNLGNIYIGDTYNNVVRKINVSGTITSIAGNGIGGFSGDGGLAVLAKLGYPLGIAMDVTGNVYIADEANNRIRQITSTVFVHQINSEYDLRVFPNPIKNYITINLISNVNELMKVIVVDIAGHKMGEISGMTNIPINIKLEKMPQGIYMLNAWTENSLFTKKIIKTE